MSVRERLAVVFWTRDNSYCSELKFMYYLFKHAMLDLMSSSSNYSSYYLHMDNQASVLAIELDNDGKE